MAFISAAWLSQLARFLQALFAQKSMVPGTVWYCINLLLYYIFFRMQAQTTPQIYGSLESVQKLSALPFFFAACHARIVRAAKSDPSVDAAYHFRRTANSLEPERTAVIVHYKSLQVGGPHSGC